MIWRILKKDMKRRKSVNIILFLFITLSSVFLSSSINNILVVVPAVDYYLDYADVPDVNFLTSGLDEKEKILDWLAEEKYVKRSGLSTIIKILNKDTCIDSTGTELDSMGATFYLTAQDADYCRVFDAEGDAFTLKPGELAMTQNMLDKNNLKPGDSIWLQAGGTRNKFTIKTAMKDAALGSEMTGMNRLFISDKDFETFQQDGKTEKMGMFYADTKDTAAFVKELNTQAFLTLVNTIPRDTYKMVYSFDMLMAGMLIVIGICLILIALLVLRFTLVFTIEEDYREIGIMKAVGLKNLSIKKMYLLKYMVLVTAGALLGLAASVPVGRSMIDSVSQNMIMEDTSANLMVNIICTALIIVFVMLFCYNCTRKLNRVSAITAIRGGQSGTRYKRRAGIRLHDRRRMPVTVFLGLNDMLSHVRRYLVLMVTFCISFILINISLNTVNTMQSAEMASKFGLDPESAVFLRGIEKAEDGGYDNEQGLLNGLQRVEKEMKAKGYDARLTAIPIFFLSYNEPGETTKNSILTIRPLGPNDKYLTYSEGTAPELSNEVAFSRSLLEENGWSIGDTVEVNTGGAKKKLIITGTYSDYMQLGLSARLNPEINLSQDYMFDYWNIMADMETELTQDELVIELQREFPEYEWATAQDVVDRNVGGIQKSLKSMILPMTGLLCAVIMLITLLMERLFIVREKGEIAMMKSMGYKTREIRLWQILRMVWVVLVSMAAAVPLSLLANRFVLKPIFSIMGAEVEIQVVPWQVYGVYPGVLLVCIILSTAAATMKMKKINIRELNNLE